MSNVKGDDIDDLFKRAADQYPLRTDSADWNKLAADLDKDRSLIIPPANSEGGDKRRRRRFFWLFLLLPLGGIGYYAWHAAAGRQHSQATNATSTSADASTDATGTKPGTPASANAAATTPGTPVTAAPTSGTPANVVTSSQELKSTHNASTSKNVATSPPKLTSKSALVSSNAPASSNATGKDATEKNADKYLRTTDKNAHSAGRNSGRHGKAVSGQPIGGQTTGTAVGTSAGERDLSLSALKSTRARTTGAINLNVNVDANKSPISAKDSSGLKNNAKRKENAKDKKQSFLYAGLIAAPDLSTVKMQTVKGVGTTFGVLLGYQFNKRWAVETGVYLDHKKYYTDGEYFKAKDLPSNYKLLNVDGYCNMWEIPVNLRYNLSSGQKTKWFATAGLSTYLMTRENYVSTISYNGMVSSNPWDIKKPSQYWFSIVNLSIGFEQKIGKIGNLRIEPYVRIPLSGLGTGSLPIMSAGLNIGITRRIW